MGLFGKNKTSKNDELIDFAFLGEGSKKDIEKFIRNTDFSKMKPDNTFYALILSGKDRFLSSRKLTRKEMYAYLALIDMTTRSLIPNPAIPASHKIYLQTLRLTAEEIQNEFNVETFLVDGKNIAIRDKSTKKEIDLY